MSVGMVRVLALALAVIASAAAGIVRASSAKPPPRVAVSAPAMPNLSGIWALDPPRSRFGNIPGGRPRSRTDVIVHRTPELVQTLYLDNGAGRDTAAYRYVTDGRPLVNRVGGSDIHATATWEGSTLHVESRTKLGAIDMTLSERWTLSADGRTLTDTRTLKSPMGGGDQTLVFVRQ